MACRAPMVRTVATSVVPGATPSSEIYATESYSGLTSDESVEKDEAELELEKLVFGDDAGFRAGLSAHQPTCSKLQRVEVTEAEELNTLSRAEHGLEAVDDEDVRSLILILQARRLLMPSAVLP